jgi:glycosyltransferase involved in cell wall biosynthesis
MEIGGAQRSASGLMSLPGVKTELVTYDRLITVSGKHYSGILIHVWCSQRDRNTMNWPEQLECKSDKMIVFNHDWRGDLCFGVDGYIVYSKFAYDNSIADAQKYIVPAGVHTSLYEPVAVDRRRRSCVVGRLSTLLDGKVSIETINFWRKIPTDRFIIGGEGPKRADLLSAFSDDPRFEFPGVVRPSDVPRFMGEIDIFLYDTSWHIESFCYVILEAMAAGCIVIVKGKGAIPELITHGINGFLYASDDHAIELCNMLIRDDNLRRKVSAKARECVSSYSLENFRSNVLAAFGW